MTPIQVVAGLIIVGGIILGIRDFEKNPGKKTKSKFLRSPSNPVASNAELFDAFNDHEEASKVENEEV